jgi:hypothetical protein
MNLKRVTIDGFGQIELNNVFFRREGAIEAQCALDPNNFAEEGKATAEKGYCENGMIVAVDKANGLVKLDDGSGSWPFALVYSTEHMYDERHNSLKDFYLPAGTFYPRLGYLKRGEIFTTNCLCYDADEIADEDALIALLDKCNETPLFAVPSKLGAIQLIQLDEDDMAALGAATVPILKVVKKTTMPNGTLGVKFQVFK